MEKCDICGKKADAFKGYVCYTSIESWLCNEHYKQWMKVAREFKKKNGDTSGNTKLCKKIEKIYLTWLKDNTKLKKTKDFICSLN